MIRYSLLGAFVSCPLTVSYSDQFYESTLAPELEDYCRLGKSVWLNASTAFS